MTPHVYTLATILWNGTSIQSPTFIYHDELFSSYADTPISSPIGPGRLLCENILATWTYVSGENVPGTDTDYFIQKRSPEDTESRLSLNANYPSVTPRADAYLNGLWACQTGSVTLKSYVGLYSRIQGEWIRQDVILHDQIQIVVPVLMFIGQGTITSNSVSLQHSSFQLSPPSFTLVGKTSGGPPTNYAWTRNGKVITNDDSYSISIAVTNNTQSNREVAGYSSTLVVTGNFPGVYKYTVSNRAMASSATDSQGIQGFISVINVTNHCNVPNV